MSRRRLPGDWSADRVRVSDIKATTDEDFWGIVDALSDMRKVLNILRCFTLDLITMPDREIDACDLRDLSRSIEKAVVLRDLAHLRATECVPMAVAHKAAKEETKAREQIQ
jgi:hypothetical protein